MLNWNPIFPRPCQSLKIRTIREHSATEDVQEDSSQTDTRHQNWTGLLFGQSFHRFF